MHFFNENNCILIQISLEFVNKGPINNMTALVQIMAFWTNDCIVYWCIYALLSLNELKIPNSYLLHADIENFQ